MTPTLLALLSGVLGALLTVYYAGIVVVMATLLVVFYATDELTTVGDACFCIGAAVAWPGVLFIVIHDTLTDEQVT